MTEIIRVMVVDDHDVVREGLGGFLSATPDMEMVGEAADGAQAVKVAADVSPDVVLMDLQMPVMGGVESTQAIVNLNQGIQVVVLTSFANEDLVQQALAAGAIGYLLKSASIHEMTAAIRAAHEGRSSLSPEATQALIKSKTRPNQSYDLKPREKEVLALMIDGMTNGQIAQALSLSLSTIKFHVSAILGKLNVESRTEAVALAVRENLLD